MAVESLLISLALVCGVFVRFLERAPGIRFLPSVSVFRRAGRSFRHYFPDLYLLQRFVQSAHHRNALRATAQAGTVAGRGLSGARNRLLYFPHLG
jgi:hypothetical protein